MARSKPLAAKSVYQHNRILTSIGRASAEKHVLRCPDCDTATIQPIVRAGDLVSCSNKSCKVQFDVVNYRPLTDVQEIREWLSVAKTKPICALDIETMSAWNALDPYTGQIVGMSLAHQPHHTIYIPFRHAVGTNASWDACKDMLAEFVTECQIAVHNASGMEWPWLYIHLGVEPNITVDTVIVSYLDDPNRTHRFDSRSVGLKEMAGEMWGIRTTEYKDLVSKDQNFGFLDVKTAYPYGCQDADLTLRLHNHLTDKVMKHQPFVFRMEHELIPQLAKMKLRGFKLNSKFLVEGSALFEKEIERLEWETYKLMGFDPPQGEAFISWERPFELGSPKRVSEHLFFKMGLPYDEKSMGKTGVPSSSADALDEYRDHYPVVNKLLECREAVHMKNSFLDALPVYVNPVTGYIHHGINQTVAPTGRFSHNAPNTAQLPKKRD